jgi:hypothetical protein
MRIFLWKILKAVSASTKQFCRNSLTDFVSRNEHSPSQSSHRCDLFRDKRRSERGGRVVRHKDQEIPDSNTNADSSPKKSETAGQEIHAHSVANCFTKTEEDLAQSISKPDAGKKSKTKEGFSVSHAKHISNRHSHA